MRSMKKSAFLENVQNIKQNKKMKFKVFISSIQKKILKMNTV